MRRRRYAARAAFALFVATAVGACAGGSQRVGERRLERLERRAERDPDALRRLAAALDDPRMFADAWLAGATATLEPDEVGVAWAAALVLVDDRQPQVADLLDALGAADLDDARRAQLARATIDQLQALARGRREADALALAEAVAPWLGEDAWVHCRIESLSAVEPLARVPRNPPATCTALADDDPIALARDLELHGAFYTAAALYAVSEAANAPLLEARALYSAGRDELARGALERGVALPLPDRIAVAAGARDAMALATLAAQATGIACDADHAQTTFDALGAATVGGLLDAATAGALGAEHGDRCGYGQSLRAITLAAGVPQSLTRLMLALPEDIGVLEAALRAADDDAHVLDTLAASVADSAQPFSCAAVAGWLQASRLLASSGTTVVALKAWVAECAANDDPFAVAEELERIGLLEMRRSLVARWLTANPGGETAVALWLADHSADRYEAWTALTAAAVGAASDADALSLRLRAIEVAAALGDAELAVASVLRAVASAPDAAATWPAAWSRIAAFVGSLAPATLAALAQAALDDGWRSAAAYGALGDARWALGESEAAIDAWLALAELDPNALRAVLSPERIAAHPAAAIRLLIALGDQAPPTADDLRRFAEAACALGLQVPGRWGAQWRAEAEAAWREHVALAGWSGVSLAQLERAALIDLVVEHPDSVGRLSRLRSLLDLGATASAVNEAVAALLSRSGIPGGELWGAVWELERAGMEAGAIEVLERIVADSCTTEVVDCARAIDRVCALTDADRCTLEVSLHLAPDRPTDDHQGEFELAREARMRDEMARLGAAVDVLLNHGDGVRADATFAEYLDRSEQSVGDLLSDYIVRRVAAGSFALDEESVASLVAGDGAGAASWYLAAEGLLRAGEYRLAREAARAALALDPTLDGALALEVEADTRVDATQAVARWIEVARDERSQGESERAEAIEGALGEVLTRLGAFTQLGALVISAARDGVVPFPVDYRYVPVALDASGHRELLDRLAPPPSGRADDLDAWAAGLAEIGEIDAAVDAWLAARAVDGWVWTERFESVPGLDDAISRDGTRVWVDRMSAEAGFARMARHPHVADFIAQLALIAGDVERAAALAELAGARSRLWWVLSAALPNVGQLDPLVVGLDDDVIRALAVQRGDMLDAADPATEIASVQDRALELRRNGVITDAASARAADAVIRDLVVLGRAGFAVELAEARATIAHLLPERAAPEDALRIVAVFGRLNERPDSASQAALRRWVFHGDDSGVRAMVRWSDIARGAELAEALPVEQLEWVAEEIASRVESFVVSDPVEVAAVVRLLCRGGRAETAEAVVEAAVARARPVTRLAQLVSQLDDNRDADCVAATVARLAVVENASTMRTAAAFAGQAGLVAEAVTLVEAARSTDSATFADDIGDIALLLDAGAPGNALALIEEALARYPDSPELRAQRMRALIGLNDAVESEVVDLWLQNPGTIVRQAFDLARAGAQAGRWDLASTPMRVLVETPMVTEASWARFGSPLPGVSWALQVVADAADIRGLDLLRELIPEVLRDPVHSGVGDQVAATLEAIGDHDAALDIRTDLWVANPDDGAAQNNLSWSLLQSGDDPALALELATESVYGDGSDVSAARLDTYVAALVASGRAEEARAWARLGVVALAADTTLPDDARAEIRARLGPLCLAPEHEIERPRRRRRDRADR